MEDSETKEGKLKKKNNKQEKEKWYMCIMNIAVELMC